MRSHPFLGVTTGGSAEVEKGKGTERVCGARILLRIGLPSLSVCVMKSFISKQRKHHSAMPRVKGQQTYHRCHHWLISLQRGEECEGGDGNWREGRVPYQLLECYSHRSFLQRMLFGWSLFGMMSDDDHGRGAYISFL